MTADLIQEFEDYRRVKLAGPEAEGLQRWRDYHYVYLEHIATVLHLETYAVLVGMVMILQQAHTWVADKALHPPSTGWGTPRCQSLRNWAVQFASVICCQLQRNGVEQASEQAMVVRRVERQLVESLIETYEGDYHADDIAGSIERFEHDKETAQDRVCFLVSRAARRELDSR